MYFYILSSILNVARTEFFQYEEKKVFQILLDFPTHYREFLSPLQFSPIASLTILADLCNHVLSLSHSWSVYNHRKTMRSLKPRRGKQHFLAFSTYSIKRSSFPCSLTSIAHYCGPMQPHTLSLSHKIHAISTTECKSLSKVYQT